jgi:hypothetical protein
VCDFKESEHNKGRVSFGITLLRPPMFDSTCFGVARNVKNQFNKLEKLVKV